MKVLIVGAGQVGCFLSQRLCNEGHEVVLVDQDQSHLDRVQEELNVMAVSGNGASAEVLEQANIKSCDIFIAVTDLDEVNILACLLAREYKVGKRLARVKSIEYSSQGAVLSKEKLGIDLLINPCDEVADEMVKIACRSGAFDVAEFVEGRIQFLGYRIGADSPLCGITLQELGELRGIYDFVVVAIARDEKTIIPRGEDVIEEGDSIYIIAREKDLPAIQYLIESKKKKKRTAPRVFILGGSQVGVRIASQLERLHFDVRLVEKNLRRCRKVAAQLEKTNVIQADGNDMPALLEEGLAQAELFIAVTGSDETNILCSLLYKQQTQGRALALVNRPELLNLAPGLGIDACVSPRMAAAGAMLKYVRYGSVVSLAAVEGSNAEVLEMEVKQDNPHIGVPLKSMGFPKGALIAAIVRGDDYQIATGESSIKAGDRVVVFALPEALTKVDRFFA
ncbi:MAG: Trk system potassium transporter TrkA [Desulfuromonadaceae bacterium]|jgi:trk system potassium uptake protein TrkA